MSSSSVPPKIRSTLPNLVTLATGELLARGLTFLAFTQLARVLSPSGFGLLESTLAIMMFCMLFVDQGFGVYGAREIAQRPDTIDELVQKVVTTQLVIAVGIVAVLLVVPRYVFADPVAARLLGLFGLSLLGVPFLLNWVFQGWNEMFWFAAPNALRQLVFLVLAVALVRELDDLMLLPLAEIAAVGTAAICYVIVLRRRGQRPSVALSALRDGKLLREAMPIGASHFIWALRMYIPIVFVSALVDTAAAGYFGAGHRIFMVFQSLLAVFFTNLLPAISQAALRERVEFRRLLWRNLHLVFWPTLLLVATVYVAAPLILGVIYGKPFVTASSESSFVVLTLIIPVLAWRRISHSALIATNNQRIEFVCSAVSTVVLLVLLSPFIRTFGFTGAAWAMLCAELLAAVLGWIALAPRLRDEPPGRAG